MSNADNNTTFVFNGSATNGQPILFPGATSPKPKKKLLIIIAAVIAAVLLVGTLAWAIPHLYIKEISVSHHKITLNRGDVNSLDVEVYPSVTLLEKAEDLNWASSNKKVAVVKDGKLTAKGEGECTITVTSKKGVSTDIKVTVIVLPEKSSFRKQATN